MFTHYNRCGSVCLTLIIINDYVEVKIHLPLCQRCLLKHNNTCVLTSSFVGMPGFLNSMEFPMLTFYRDIGNGIAHKYCSCENDLSVTKQ